jgi:hypothetical protein
MFGEYLLQTMDEYVRELTALNEAQKPSTVEYLESQSYALNSICKYTVEFVRKSIRSHTNQLISIKKKP